MSPGQILSLAPALKAYFERYRACFLAMPLFERFTTYCRGLLSNLKRKSVEPMALAAGSAVRTIQYFLSDTHWDHDLMQRLLLQQVAAEVRTPASGTPVDRLLIGVIDETSVAKKGDMTPGVNRQYCGSKGKTDNCIVSVHLGCVRGDFKTLLASDLFLPASWSKDRKRCQTAKIPDELVHRTKPRIAIEQIKHAVADGINFDYLTYDEGYGRDPQFLFDLEELGLIGVGEVPKNFRCLGQVPSGYAPGDKLTGKKVYNVARHSNAFVYQSWTSFSIPRETMGPQWWDVKAAQVHLLRHGELVDRTFWLIMAWNPATEEYKYFVSNAPPEAPLATLISVAFKRANIEHIFRIVKSEIGFDHFEGRSYQGLTRHMILCQVIMLFLALQTKQLRAERRKDQGRRPNESQATMEQTAYALNDLCRRWMADQTARHWVEQVSFTTDYHERRNEAARRSRQRELIDSG
jgi:SRSO17 transposase